MFILSVPDKMPQGFLQQHPGQRSENRQGIRPKSAPLPNNQTRLSEDRNTAQNIGIRRYQSRFHPLYLLIILPSFGNHGITSSKPSLF
jgi:hypothetical protein